MNTVSKFARRTLWEHPSPALRLSELVVLLAERVDLSLDSHRLRLNLERYPAVFTIVDPLKKPWQRVLSNRDGEASNPWVLGISVPPQGLHLPDSTTPAFVMRESIRWLASRLDSESPSEALRWYGMLMAEREARRALGGGVT